MPVPSRSEPEPSGEPKFEEEACAGCLETFVPSHTCHEKSWETTKLGCRHVDNTKPEKLVTQKSHTARSRRKWLEPQWLRMRVIILSSVRCFFLLDGRMRATVLISGRGRQHGRKALLSPGHGHIVQSSSRRDQPRSATMTDTSVFVVLLKRA